MNKYRTMNNTKCVRLVPYVAEVGLVHLDLFDIGGVVGCVDLVLVFVVVLSVQTLRKERDQCIYFTQQSVTDVSHINSSCVSSYIVDNLVSLP